MDYYFKVLTNFSFRGRARRSEYWWFAVVNAMAGFALRMLGVYFGLMLNVTDDGAIAINHDATPDSVSIPALVYALLTIIQGIAVIVRRLHDRGISGWWIFTTLPVVIIAGLAHMPWLVYVFCFAALVIVILPGTQGPNKYGEDPKAPTY